MAKYYPDPEQEPKQTGSWLLMSGLSQDNIFYAGFVITELVGILIIILVGVLFSNNMGGFSFDTPKQAFNYHPLFMTIGMIFLNANGILIYRVTRTWKLKPQKIAHSVIQICAMSCSVFGLYAVFYFHNEKDIPNMYSLHSWLGIIAIGGLVISWPAAFITFLWPGLSPVIRRLVLPFHIFSGNITFALSAAVVISGLTEKAIFELDYKNLPHAAKLLNIIGLLCVLFTILVLWLLTKPEFKRRYIPGVNEAQYHMAREASID